MHNRAPTYNMSRMVLTLLLCLFYGSLYFGQGHIPQSGEGPLPGKERLPYTVKGEMERGEYASVRHA